MVLLKLLSGQWFELEAIQFGQDCANVHVISNFASLNLLKYERLDGLFDALSVTQIENRVDHPFSLWLFGTDPAFASVPIVAKGVEEAFRPWGCGIERPPRIELKARDQEVQFNIAHVLVANPEDICLVGFEPGERGLLKIPHHIGLLCF